MDILVNYGIEQFYLKEFSSGVNAPKQLAGPSSALLGTLS
jgi:hypothetical protein